MGLLDLLLAETGPQNLKQVRCVPSKPPKQPRGLAARWQAALTQHCAAATPSSDNEEESLLDQEIMNMLSSISGSAIAPHQQQQQQKGPAAAAGRLPDHSSRSGMSPLSTINCFTNILAASNSITSSTTACNSPSTPAWNSNYCPGAPAHHQQALRLPAAAMLQHLAPAATEPASACPTQPARSAAGAAGSGRRGSTELSGASSNSSKKRKMDTSGYAMAATMRKHMEQLEQQLADSVMAQAQLKHTVAALQADNANLLSRVAELTEKFQETVADNAELYKHVIALEQQLQLAGNADGGGSSCTRANSSLAALYLQMQQR